MSIGPSQRVHLIGIEEIRRTCGWFLAVGAALVMIGLIALIWSVMATLVSVIIFGWLLLIAGAVALFHALLRRRWGGFFIELFTGLLYLVVGLMVVGNPAQSAIALTLLIALFLQMGGIFRIVTALVVRFHHWIWMLLNGVVSLLLGLMIWAQWPWSGLWVIGLFIGIEMIFYGWSLIMLGIALRRIPEQRYEAL